MEASMERFMLKVEKTDTCWNWTGRLFDNTGYGQFNINSRPISAHRFAYKNWKGPCDGFVVRHTCDNRKCVNPDHLLLGTQADNIRDKVERGRQSKGAKHAASITYPYGDDWKRIHMKSFVKK